jgi:signal peptidase
VQKEPASTLQIGDIVTVDRAGDLPITHRITSISPGPTPDQRIITMKGDANATEDPSPYTISEGRIVRGSVPGLAYVIVWFGDPIVLGVLTVGAAALVTWAFWPRARRGASGPDAGPKTADDADATSEAPTTRAELRRRAAGVLVIGLIVGAAGALTPTPPASASGMLSIRSSLKSETTYHLDPHTPFFWDLDVDASAAPDDGSLSIDLSGTATAGMRVVAEVRSCETAWSAQDCATGDAVLRAADALPMDGTAVPLQRRATPAVAHLRIALTATVDDAPSATATFTVHALAEQDAAELEIGGDAGLAKTGGVAQAYLAAPAAVLTGLGIALIARSRNRRAQR